jgi:hypothetical protein
VRGSPVDKLEFEQRDHEFGAVYDEALRLQEMAEKAGMSKQARQAREIRRQAHVRLLALHANRPSEGDPN